MNIKSTYTTEAQISGFFLLIQITRHRQEIQNTQTRRTKPNRQRANHLRMFKTKTRIEIKNLETYELKVTKGSTNIMNISIYIFMIYTVYIECIPYKTKETLKMHNSVRKNLL